MSYFEYPIFNRFRKCGNLKDQSTPVDMPFTARRNFGPPIRGVSLHLVPGFLSSLNLQEKTESTGFIHGLHSLNKERHYMWVKQCHLHHPSVITMFKKVVWLPATQSWLAYSHAPWPNSSDPPGGVVKNGIQTP